MQFKLDEDEELAKLLSPDSVQEHAHADHGDDLDNVDLHKKEDIDIENLLRNDRVKSHSWEIPDDHEDGREKSNRDNILGKKLITFFFLSIFKCT